MPDVHRIFKRPHIVFILPSFSAGGLERVASTLINYFAGKDTMHIAVITFSSDEIFYPLPDNVNIYRPDFNYKKYGRLRFTSKLFFFLRKQLKVLQPNYIVSFSGRYNSFNLIASLGITAKVFISDRSNPEISYGYWLDKLNLIMYRRAYGIIAQTKKAAEVHIKRIHHKNIRIIGNPIHIPVPSIYIKENIILNVGRFIGTKHQDKLIKYFNEINDAHWKLLFLGDGKYFDKCLQLANNSKLRTQIELSGVVKNVNDYYSKAAIFAFTSSSEGFPNALAEAMAHGCACISYDCIAGPADLIDDGVNGFLIPEGNEKLYIERLQLLMEDADLRKRFGLAAREKMKQFNADKIAQLYLDFILTENS